MLDSLDFHRITKIEVHPSIHGPLNMDHGVINVHRIILTDINGQKFRISAFSAANGTIDVVVNQPVTA